MCEDSVPGDEWSLYFILQVIHKMRDRNIIIKIIAILGILYITLSTTEWAIHKYIMHTKVSFLGSFVEMAGKAHITHHIATRPDMSIDKRTFDYDVLGKTENMCLFWSEIIPILFILLVVSFILARGMKVSVWIPVVISIVLGGYSVSMWNTLHPAIHERSGYSLGAPLAVKEGTVLYDILINSQMGKFLREYHILHHNIKKPHKTNFNITVPFADYVYGTHSSYVS